MGADGVLRTPPLEEHILASITRELVMGACAVEERAISRDELLADVREAFLASTTREVQPVGAIEHRDLGEPGPVTAAAAECVRALIAAELGSG